MRCNTTRFNTGNKDVGVEKMPTCNNKDKWFKKRWGMKVVNPAKMREVGGAAGTMARVPSCQSDL